MIKLFIKLVFVFGLTFSVWAVQAKEPTNLYWGDTHLHTNNSPDAYNMKNRTADPDTAYRYAKGLPVVHPYHRARVQIHTPLDFLVVADHGEYMGVMPRLFAGDPLLANTPKGKELVKMANSGKSADVAAFIIGSINKGEPNKDLNSKKMRRAGWDGIMNAAERHNEPGKFTTFLGWEWSSTTGGANLHRVVFIKNGKSVGKKFLPFTAFDSDKPEDLWKWLATTSKKTGASFIAIPHNSNVSKGQMFNTVDSRGRPITAKYAHTRMRWEPVVEITQIKGDSETHPKLSPTDEFADHETYTHTIDATTKVGHKKPKATISKADYVRSALKRGLEIASKVGANPYKVGLIGSTDAHSGIASAEENNFHGKFGLDSVPEMTPKELLLGIRGYDMAAAGLVAVWAPKNTRGALFAAFHRKEVYATTGPRIRVRFFGGWDYKSTDADSRSLATIGYRKGVPMGGNLARAPRGKAPTFLIHAVKGPKSGNLDRIQVVKGWLGADGKAREKVFNVAVSDGRKIRNNRVKPVGNTVNLKTASYTNSIGDPQLAVVWKDPSFKAKQRAFYYARVLQIPTPRHTLYDTVALGIKHSRKYPSTIQERAYSSPIWYTP